MATYEYTRNSNTGEVTLVLILPGEAQDPDNIFNPTFENVTSQEVCIVSETSPTNEVCLKTEDAISSDYDLYFPAAVGSAGKVLELSGDSETFIWADNGGGGGDGDVFGPASSTLNALARYSSTTGKAIKNSSVILDDVGNVSGIANLTATGAIDLDQCTSFNVETTDVGANSCELFVNGDATSELHIENKTGITSDSVRIDSGLGGIDIDAQNDIIINAATGRIDLHSVASVNNNAVQIRADSGGIDINCASRVDIKADDTGVGAIKLDASAGGIDMNSTKSINMTSTEATDDAVRIDCTVGGCDVDVETNFRVDSATGKIDLRAVGNATDNSVELNSTLGGISLVAGTTIKLNDAEVSSVGQISTPENILIDTADSNNNTLYGFGAGGSITSGNQNVLIGQSAGILLEDSNTQVAVGYQALSSLVSGSTQNTAVGYQALRDHTSGVGNTAVGYIALFDETSSSESTAVGAFCMTGNHTRSTAIGKGSMGGNTAESDNSVAVGYQSLRDSSGDFSVALGSQACQNVVTGANNCCIGYQAGLSLTLADSNNIIIENSGIVGDVGKIRLGNSTDHDETFIAGIHQVIPSGSIEVVTIDANNQLGSEPIERATESTGVVGGGIMSINVDTTKFDITDGNGFIHNPDTNTTIEVSWTGLTAQSTAYAGFETFVFINSGGTVTYGTAKPANSEIRDDIFLGTLLHLNNINIDSTQDEQMSLNNSTNQIRDLAEAIGNINISGNSMFSNSLLTVAKTTGKMHRFGSNYETDRKDPNVINLPAKDTNVADTFTYIYQDSSVLFSLTDVDPGSYDDGNGSGSPGSVGNNEWTVQRIYIISTNALLILPGQFVYGNKDDAIDNINKEGFILPVALADNSMSISFLAVKGNATNLSDIATAEFLSAGKFGTSVIGASSTGGDVTGPGSSTNLAIAKYDGTSGTLLLDSGVTINASNAIIGALSVGLRNTNPNTITIRPNTTMSSNFDFQFPPDQGVLDGVMTTDGSSSAKRWARPAFNENHIDKLIISNNTASIKTIGVGECRSAADNFNIYNTAVRNPDITASGVNGLDTGSEASDTWYAIFIIADSSGVNVPAGLFSLSPTSPTMPSGYNAKRLIGWVRNNASSDFYDFSSSSTGRDRTIYYEEDESVLEVYNSESTVFIDIDVSDLLPPTAQEVYLNCQPTDISFFKKKGSGASTPSQQVLGNNSVLPAYSSTFWLPTDTGQIFEYKQTSLTPGSTIIRVVGYVDII